MPYSLVLERASGTHKYSVQLKLGLLTSTCSVVCLPPQGYFNKLRLAVSEALGFISLWCLGAQRKGMVINMGKKENRPVACTASGTASTICDYDSTFVSAGQDMTENELIRKVTEE